MYGPYAAASGVNFSGAVRHACGRQPQLRHHRHGQAGQLLDLNGKFTVAASGGGNVYAKSLARSAVMQSLSAGATSSAKVEWLYDVPSLSGANKSTSTTPWTPWTPYWRPTCKAAAQKQS